MRVVADAQRRAVLENHARRALNLDCDWVQRILEPADFKLLAIECAGLDSAAVVVWHELLLLVEPADPHTFVWKCHGARLMARGDQISRAAVKRDVEFAIGKARTLNDRLEITG